MSEGLAHRGRLRRLLSLAALVCAAPVAGAEAPMADVHLHFNWNQKEVISAGAAVQRLRERNVVLAIVSSVPSDHAAKLREAGGEWIVPFYTPYVTPRSRVTWYVQEEVPGRVRAALASGRYFGIGELHLVSGLGPRRDNAMFLELIELAREFDVPMLIHTDSSSHLYFLPICRANRDVRFLWAHAGGILSADEVGALIEACPNVWVELSARDPWHYGAITGTEGALLPQWAALVRKFPERFMTGTDPVWNAQQVFRWWEADEGWFHYDELNRYHRTWLRALPAGVAERVRLRNAQDFLGVRGR